MSDRRVHLWPARDAFIDGVPAVELSVTPDVADALTAYQPPAFHRAKPDWWDATYPDGKAATDEDMFRLERFLAPTAPPDAVAVQQPEGPADAGPPDSTEVPA
jgi:hypothetical protein